MTETEMSDRRPIVTLSQTASHGSQASAAHQHAWRRLSGHLLMLLAYVVIVAATHWPLATHLGTHVIGTPYDDVFEVLWQIRWMRSAVFEQHVNPFYAPDVFYPKGWYVASGAQPSWYMLVLAVPSALLGEVVVYNLTLLGTFVLAGFGLYLLAYQLTHQRLASLVAGCVYITAPVLTLRLGGHLHLLLGMQWLPYSLLLAWRALASAGRAALRWAILAGVALALVILGNWYYVFIAVLPLIGFLLFARQEKPWPSWLLVALVMGVTCAILIAPFAVLTLQARQEMFAGQEAEFTVAQSDVFSMSPDRLIVPNLINSLWGRIARRAFPPVGEQDIVSIGYAAIILAFLGVVGARGSSYPRKPFVVLGLMALILAMGTTLHWATQRVEFSALSRVGRICQSLTREVVADDRQAAIPLPGLFLAKFLPFYSAMRVWARFDIPLMVAIGVLAAYGGSRLTQKGPALRIVLGCLGLLVLVEGLIIPYRDFTPVAINARPTVNQWLAAQPKGTVIIEYPRQNPRDTIAMYSQSFHGQRVVNGYMSFVPAHLRKVESQLGQWPTEQTLPILRDWGVDYVLVSASGNADMQQSLAQVRSLPGLAYVRSFNEGFMGWTETHVFRVLKPGEAPLDRSLTLDKGFAEPHEGVSGLPARWTEGTALLLAPWPQADTAAPADLCFALQVAGARYEGAEPCRLVVKVEEVTVFEGEIPNDAAPRLLVLEAQAIPNTGLQDLEIRLEGNTWVPDEIDGHGDKRHLGVLFYDAKLQPYKQGCGFAAR